MIPNEDQLFSKWSPRPTNCHTAPREHVKASVPEHDSVLQSLWTCSPGIRSCKYTFPRVAETGQKLSRALQRAPNYPGSHFHHKGDKETESTQNSAL